jgi:hypothetical protein
MYMAAGSFFEEREREREREREPPNMGNYKLKPSMHANVKGTPCLKCKSTGMPTEITTSELFLHCPGICFQRYRMYSFLSASLLSRDWIAYFMSISALGSRVLTNTLYMSPKLIARTSPSQVVQWLVNNNLMMFMF